MINIISYYDIFSFKQQSNTYWYYNNIFCKYLSKYDWFIKISNDEYTRINNIIKSISSNQSKEYIEPYYKIYNYYLKNYKHIFNENNTFIDLGTAPGGFVKFATEQKMVGYGITLESGLKMKYKFDNIIYKNLLKDEIKLDINKVDFINLGAVLYDKENNEQYLLLINQFKIVNQYLKKNGAIMFVYDSFYTLFNCIKIFNLFIENECKINIIPVQPTFETSQLYILIENLNLTNKMFEQIVGLIQYKYIAITNNYYDVINKIMTSNLFNINSFRDAYLIKVLYNHTLKNNKIIKELIPVVNLDIIHISKYNYKVLSFDDLLIDIEKYEYLREITNKIKDVRKKFIKKNNILFDKTDEEYKYILINKFISQLDKYLIYKLTN